MVRSGGVRRALPDARTPFFTCGFTHVITDTSDTMSSNEEIAKVVPRPQLRARAARCMSSESEDKEVQ
jgi:hypothetical protein